MEKLVCSACGAPLTPNTDQPYLTCEYCDTAVPNAFYREPVPAAQPAPAAEAKPVEAESGDPLSAIVETVGGVARTLVQRALINRSLQRSLRQRPLIWRSTVHPTIQQVRPPHRPGTPNPRVQQPHGMRPPMGGRPGHPMGGPKPRKK